MMSQNVVFESSETFLMELSKSSQPKPHCKFTDHFAPTMYFPNVGTSTPYNFNTCYIRFFGMIFTWYLFRINMKILKNNQICRDQHK